jgi:hypothetical protein
MGKLPVATHIMGKNVIINPLLSLYSNLNGAFLLDDMWMLPLSVWVDQLPANVSDNFTFFVVIKWAIKMSKF